MTTTYEFDDLDLELIRELRSAIRDVDEFGIPAKDCLDEDDMLDAVRLLLNVVGQDVAPFVLSEEARDEEGAEASDLGSKALTEEELSVKHWQEFQKETLASASRGLKK